MGRATNLRRQMQQEQDGGESSSSSSTETNYIQIGHNSFSNSSCCLSTDLRLGLTISSSDHTSSSSRHNYNEWPQIPSLFVKVNMEGIPIGRKLDLMSHDGYHTLVSTLSHMFKVPILCPDVNYKHISEKEHILTYEDKDGDWMLVGDVPWEMFLSTVKKLRITKADDGS